MGERSTLNDLQHCYAEQCDGDWEHGEGVEIRTLDNPGWRVRLSLGGTNLQELSFERVKIERSEDDWIHAWVENNSWQAACGPLNLEESLRLFLGWASSSG